MADEAKPQKKKSRIRKMPETIRERADKQTVKKNAPPNKLRGKIVRPLSAIRKVGSKEYHPIPVPNNKAGKILKKRVRFVPKFIREAWAELKLVTWPSRNDAARLTFAVFAFAIFFAIFVQVLDLLFNKLVKEIFVK